MILRKKTKKTGIRSSILLIDHTLLFTTLLLISIGLIMVYSSSSVYALKNFESEFFFLRKQSIFACIGFFLLAIFAHIDHKKIYPFIYPFLGLSLFLLTLSFIPPFSAKINGATRWIKLFSLTFQPSELAKIAIIAFVAYSTSSKQSKIKSFKFGILPNLLIPGILILLILLQRDFGTAVTISIIIILMLFTSGISLIHLFGMFLLSCPLIYSLIAFSPYRLKRWLTFLNPWSDPSNAGFQTIQSLMSFHNGGLTGSGIAQSKQKLFFLPEAHNDFIFSIIGEEFGLIGSLTVIALFAFFAYRGYRIAMRIPFGFSSQLALGLTALIAVQGIIHMAVTMALLPPKGITLPFISYGGNSLLISMICVGILLNISKGKYDTKITKITKKA